jgi:hypothetical protein
MEFTVFNWFMAHGVQKRSQSFSWVEGWGSMMVGIFIQSPQRYLKFTRVTEE